MVDCSFGSNCTADRMDVRRPEYFISDRMQLNFIGCIYGARATPKIILLLYPTTLFTFYFYQKKVFDKISSNESPYSNKTQSYTGQTGVFIIKESKNESESYFYDYKKNISVENEHTPPIAKTLRVILDSNGETHSAIDESGLLKNNDKVVIKNELSGSLIVEKINN